MATPTRTQICVCGTEVPERGTDFEPGCRFCDRLHAARGLEEAAR